VRRLGPSWSRYETPGYRPPAGGVPAAGTGAGVPAAGPTPAPLDLNYLNQLNLNATAERQTIGGLTAQRQRALQGYGFSGQFDPVTDALVAGSLKIDPTDPYSQAAMLKSTYDANRVGTGLQRAARGGLYAGAYQTAQDAVTRGQLKAEDTLQKSLMSYLEGVGGQIGATRTARQQSDIDAAIAAGSRAQDYG
jgi:hypothetical protein